MPLRIGTFAPDEGVGVVVHTEPEATMDLLDAVASTHERATGFDLPALTVFDSCDAPDCSAQAYVRARFPSGLELVFCGHHGHDLMPSLVGRGAVVRDDSHLLTADRRLEAGN
jgi:hypothetical protein